MTKYLISFPAPAMDIPEEDWVEVGEAARAVMREAKHAGAYVFGGGINFASPGRGPCRLARFTERQLESNSHLPQDMAKKNRDITRTYSRAQFVAKLRRLADSLEAGDPFVIQVAGERLHIPAEMTFNIEHERAGDTDELEFQVVWQRR